MRVLVVDDDAATRSGLAELLESAGYESLSVGSFAEALHLLHTTRLDLLITDVRLDGGSGVQLVIDNPNRVPTIVLTGVDDATVAADARRQGAVYLLKPVSPEMLLAHIRNLFTGVPPE